MSVDHIIVQAGGKGSRMQILTRNKPKALVPVENLPILFHLFRQFPQKRFVIIGDYKYDVLERYLAQFADVDYALVHASGHTGNCAGIREALAHIPDHEPFALVWCDIILPDSCDFPSTGTNVVGVAKDLACRWSYLDGKFCEQPSESHGVPGYFIFSDKTQVAGVPEDGEFVQWLQGAGIRFEEQPLYGLREYGIYNKLNGLPMMRCRPFNRLAIDGHSVVKTPVDEQGRMLSRREVAWYRKLQDTQLDCLPTVLSYDPLTLELVNGRNVYDYTFLNNEQKRCILERIIHCLRQLHGLESSPFDAESYRHAYITKTFDRLEKVRDLVPFANDPIVIVNGRACRNIFFQKDEVERRVMQYAPSTFALLHGDCTFSNILLRDDSHPVLIDPRGYFGTTEFYGDAAYDWVKLYYSIVSNYDQFNLGRFSLTIGEDAVELNIASNNWENMEGHFFELLEDEVCPRQMKLLLAIVWLSLTTYAWEDYDSICGAFYNGLYYLEEALGTQSAFPYFESTVGLVADGLRSVSMDAMERLINDCATTLKSGGKIIATGLGKNVPICEKFEGTMLSLGLDAQFMHANSALHGDLGMVRSDDLVITLSKSGETAESVQLAQLLCQRRDVTMWLISAEPSSTLSNLIERCLIAEIRHEGDPWNIMPNNSSTVFLILLQTLAMQLAVRMGVTLETFKSNHPAGAIGAALRDLQE